MEVKRGHEANHPHLVIHLQLQSAGLAPAPLVEGIMKRGEDRLRHDATDDAVNSSVNVNDAGFVGAIHAKIVAHLTG